MSKAANNKKLARARRLMLEARKLILQVMADSGEYTDEFVEELEDTTSDLRFHARVLSQGVAEQDEDEEETPSPTPARGQGAAVEEDEDDDDDEEEDDDDDDDD